MEKTTIRLDSQGGTLRTGRVVREIKRPDLDLYIHPAFKKTRRGEKTPLLEVLTNWLKGF
jgi:hypothetical protein